MRVRWFALLATVALFACGKDEDALQSDAVRGAPTVKVRPASADLAPYESKRFQAITAADVTWSVREAGGGAITAAGLYTAPGAPGIYHVVAAAAGSSGEAVVNVRSSVTIAAPATAATDACVPLQLAATVSGSSDTGVVWSVLDTGCGAVSSSGVYERASPGTCRVQAAAHADPSAVAVTTVTITERVLGVAVSPASVILAPGGTAPFTATVTTTCGTFTSPAGTP